MASGVMVGSRDGSLQRARKQDASMEHTAHKQQPARRTGRWQPPAHTQLPPGRPCCLRSLCAYSNEFATPHTAPSSSNPPSHRTPISFSEDGREVAAPSRNKVSRCMQGCTRPGACRAAPGARCMQGCTVPHEPMPLESPLTQPREGRAGDSKGHAGSRPHLEPKWHRA